MLRSTGAPYTGGTLQALAKDRARGTLVATGGSLETEPSQAVRIAYLLGQYPAVAQTFVLDEILGLRARGLHIETASINRPDRDTGSLPLAEAAEAATTFYLTDRRRFGSLEPLLRALLMKPGTLFRGFSAVRTLRRGGTHSRFSWLVMIGRALLLGRWMQERRLSHVHVQFGESEASVVLLAAKMWNVTYSLTVQGSEELLNTNIFETREKALGARFVFCISDFCRSQLCRLTPSEQWEKFEVVRLGVDPVVLTPHSRTTPGLEGGTRTLELVCIGSLIPAKGQLVLIEALRLLRDRGVALRATLIGGGSEFRQLKRYTMLHGLEHVVTFTSALSHSQTLGHLRRCDLFALASFTEGIPLALMEAMSLGVPCVGTSVAGLPELIRTGVDGILVPPANACALADALQMLIADAALRKAFGASGRRRIISDYNLPLNQELLSRQFTALLRKQVERPEPRATFPDICQPEPRETGFVRR